MAIQQLEASRILRAEENEDSNKPLNSQDFFALFYRMKKVQTNNTYKILP